MRLLQLNPNGDESSALDFHPMVTVVTALSPAGRDKVIQAITALPRGDDPHCHGLLEAHGILLDLAPDTLRLLDLDGELDVLVRPADVRMTRSFLDEAPADTEPPRRDPLASVLPDAVEPLSAEAFLAITPEGEFPELDAIRFRGAQAREALIILREAADRARAGHEAAQVRRRRAELALQAAHDRSGRANLRLVTDSYEPEDDVDGPDLGATPMDVPLDESIDESIDDPNDPNDPNDPGDHGWPADHGGPELAVAPLTDVDLDLDPDPDPDLDPDPDPDPDPDLALDLDLDGHDDVAPVGIDPPLGAVADEHDEHDEQDADDGGEDGSAVGATGYPDAAEIAALRRQLVERQEELHGDVERIDRGVRELAGVDVRPLQVLLEAIHSPAPVEYASSARGQELAEEFVRLQREVQALEESLDARGLGSAAAMSRLDIAREEMAYAERAMRPPSFTDEDRAELESAHDEVLESERKSRGRSGKKRLEDAIERERAVLDRMGFPTWSAYVMGSSLMGIDPAAEQRLERARFELDAAEQHWSDVAAMIEADPHHRDLLDQLEAVYLEAFDLLGGDDDQQDLEERLRLLQEPKRDVSTDELVDALAYQLELVGLGLPPGAASIDRVVLIAEAFLEEASAIQDRIRELGEEKVEALTELQIIEADLEGLPTDEQLARLSRHDEHPSAGMDDELIDLTSVVAGADEPEVDLEDLEHELEAALEEEADYLELVESRDALMDAALQVETVAHAKMRKLAAELAIARADAETAELSAAWAEVEAEVESEAEFPFEPDAAPTATADYGAPGGSWDPSGSSESPDERSSSLARMMNDEEDDDREKIEFYLLARLAALRSVSFAGSVPLVIDDALLGLPPSEVEALLSKLERMSESVQIVYLSDDEVVRTWADGVGFERAAVVRAPVGFG